MTLKPCSGTSITIHLRSLGLRGLYALTATRLGRTFHYSRTSIKEDTLTYAMPFDTHTLTIGDSLGVPWYFLEKINHIFCCDITLVEWVQVHPRTGDLEIEWTSKKNRYRDDL